MKKIIIITIAFLLVTFSNVSSAGLCGYSGKLNGNVSALDPEMSKALDCLKTKSKAAGINIRAVSTIRTFAEQEKLYAKGRCSSGSSVTKARAGYSYHNFGLAFDIYYNGFYKDVKKGRLTKINKIAKIAKEQCCLAWGGDWSGFKDMPHFQPRSQNKTHHSILRKKYKNQIDNALSKIKVCRKVNGSWKYISIGKPSEPPKPTEPEQPGEEPVTPTPTEPTPPTKPPEQNCAEDDPDCNDDEDDPLAPSPEDESGDDGYFQEGGIRVTQFEAGISGSLDLDADELLDKICAESKKTANQGLLKYDGVCDEKSGIQGLFDTIQEVLSWLIKIAMIIAVFALFYTGFKFIAANGNPGKIEDAKSSLVKVIIGLFFILSAFFIVDFVFDLLLIDPSYKFLNNVQ
ncbi:hypothetical protein CSB11_02795 [Candidatus Campbellbacteria bacterium]|nr:MAG: hypothetical protein CSB11_02795 [Candidatus Campbellbacteria bacterium]